jgi:hypothetical protein
MNVDTKQKFVDYAMEEFSKLDNSAYYLFPVGLFEEIAKDMAYILGGSCTKKQILDILCEEEYNPEKMITTASYIPHRPSKEEILEKRIKLAEKCWELKEK